MSLLLLLNTPNRQPTVTLNTPLDAAVLSTNKPVFEFIGSDAESEDIHYGISVSPNLDFSSPVVSVDSSVSSVDFTNITNNGDTAPYTSGHTVTFTVTSALPDGTYYWTVRATDANGSNHFGDWTVVRSFQISAGVVVNTSRGMFFGA